MGIALLNTDDALMLFVELQVSIATVNIVCYSDRYFSSGAKINILVGIVNEKDAVAGNAVDTTAIFMDTGPCAIWGGYLVGINAIRMFYNDAAAFFVWTTFNPVSA